MGSLELLSQINIRMHFRAKDKFWVCIKTFGIDKRKWKMGKTTSASHTILGNVLGIHRGKTTSPNTKKMDLSP